MPKKFLRKKDFSPSMEIRAEEILEDMKCILQEVGTLLREGFTDQNKDLHTKKNANDFVTKYDTKANQLILDFLMKKYPSFGFLSEELPEINSKEDFYFIIDPIDGTINFAHSIPIFCTGVALAKGDEVFLCATYAVMQNELFWAIKDKGAFCNGRQIHVADKGTGGRIQTREREPQLSSFPSLVNAGFVLGNFNSLHYELAMVASGRCDATLTADAPWDLCQCLLVLEAGGKITDHKGDSFTLAKTDLLTGSPNVHTRILSVLKKK